MSFNHPVHLHPVKQVGKKKELVTLKIPKLKPLRVRFDEDQIFRTSRGDILKKSDIPAGVVVVLHGHGFTAQVALS
jgi:hypothetical protein